MVLLEDFVSVVVEELCVSSGFVFEGVDFGGVVFDGSMGRFVDSFGDDSGSEVGVVWVEDVEIGQGFCEEIV